MRILLLLATIIAAVAAVPKNPQRIVGGSVTNINQYPYAAALLFSWTGTGTFGHSCGGSIVTARTILTAAHCLIGDPASRWRTRVGSTNAHSGGSVFNSLLFILHPQYNPSNEHFDMALIRLTANIPLNNIARQVSIAGPNYNMAYNQQVWTIGWGRQWSGGPVSEQLRHVQVWTINTQLCRQRYAANGLAVTDAMLCAGWLDVGGRDACQGDSGGPLLHNNVQVGVVSWGIGCALAQLPGVYARVSSASNWIQANA